MDEDELGVYIQMVLRGARSRRPRMHVRCEEKTDIRVIWSPVRPLSRPGYEINDQEVYRAFCRTLIVPLCYPCSLVTFVVPFLPPPPSI